MRAYMYWILTALVVAGAVVLTILTWKDPPVSSPQTTYTQVRVIASAIADFAKAHYHLYHL